MKTKAPSEMQATVANPAATVQRRTAFTLIELLVVISIIGILAGLVVGLAKIVGTRKTESTVKTELKQLELVFESYKSKVGSYPPDNTNNSLLPPLYYELLGTIASADGRIYRTLQSSEDTIKQQNIKAAFGLMGFMNSGEDARNFYPNLKAERVFTLTNIGGVQIPEGVKILVSSVRSSDGGRVPWHYNSSNPTNNPPGSYDLWVEIVSGGKTNIIGNWKD
jgi:prepilin-type N-terminal cleavage/methylation domain-containing protein